MAAGEVTSLTALHRFATAYAEGVVPFEDPKPETRASESRAPQIESFEGKILELERFHKVRSPVSPEKQLSGGVVSLRNAARRQLRSLS